MLSPEILALLDRINSSAPTNLVARQLRPPSGNSVFSPWQVESLLNQSADLLDRCIRAKAEADEFWVEEARAQIQDLQDGHARALIGKEQAHHVAGAAYEDAELKTQHWNMVANDFWFRYWKLHH